MHGSGVESETVSVRSNGALSFKKKLFAPNGKIVMVAVGSS